jgi:hypothetical protein
MMIVAGLTAALLRGPNRIDLANYTLTWSEEFDGPLDVSSCGPATKWIYNKPDGGNFGGVGWGDVFSVAGGILTIAAKKVSGVWHAGILASVDCTGAGFAQQYGYWEMRAQFPAGVGHNWPAFWLLKQAHIVTRADPDVEIDIVEQYGNFFPRQLNFVYHYWTTPPVAIERAKIVGDMSSAYHTYGVSIDPSWIIWFFDQIEIGRMATPPEAKTPMYVLVDLALSGDPSTWDTGTTDPSLMLIDYVRVYRRN